MVGEDQKLITDAVKTIMDNPLENPDPEYQLAQLVVGAGHAPINADDPNSAMLHIAVLLVNACVENGDMGLARRTLHETLCLRQDGVDCNNILLSAAYSGKLIVVKLLLERRETNINYHSSKDPMNPQSPLVVACFQGHLDVVKHLLEQRKIDVNNRAAQPLIVAIKFGHMKILKALLNHPKIDVNMCTHDGTTPLLIAAQEGRSKAVQLLLADDRINVNSMITVEEVTPMWTAISKNRLEVIRLLLQHKDINVNYAGKKKQFWMAPLHTAIMFKHARIVKILLECEGIDVNVRNGPLSVTPLYEAADKGLSEIVRLLLTCKSVDVNTQCLNGSTPLFIASYKGHANVVKLLLNHQLVDIDITSGMRGSTAFFWACCAGNTVVMKVFLKSHHEIDVDSVQGVLKVGMSVRLFGEGFDPTEHFSEEKYKKVLKLLVEHKAKKAKLLEQLATKEEEAVRKMSELELIDALD